MIAAAVEVAVVAALPLLIAQPPSAAAVTAALSAVAYGEVAAAQNRSWEPGSGCQE